MGFYLSPLVDVKETDLSTTIPAVATSIAAIVLRNAYKGPELKRTLLTSEEDLVYMFGEPNDDNYKDWFSAAGFLKYGNKLYGTRAMPDTVTGANPVTGAKFSEILVSASGTYGRSISGVSLSDLEQSDPDMFGEKSLPSLTTGVTGNISGTVSPTMWFIADSRGAWGNNIRIAFLDRATQYGLGLKSGMAGYITGSDTGPYRVFKTLDNRIAYNVASPVANPTPTAPSRDFLVLVQCKDQRKNDFVTKESWNVSTDINALDDQGASRYIERVINSSSQYIKVSLGASFDGITIPSSTGMTQDIWWTLVSGTNGTTITQSDATDSKVIEAFDLYSNPEELDVNIFIESDNSITVKNSLITICEDRMDCMAVMDVPKAMVYNNRGKETVDLLNWINVTFNPNTSYASCYANWIEIYDKYNQKYRWIPSSGYVAGIYAKTDSTNDAWWAPAGLNRAVLTGVRRLAWNPSLGNRDLLYSNKLNPIVSFSGQGKVIWGQKTLLAKSSAFDRINVRRLFIVLEKAISTAAKYFLFEPNDPATRSLLINMINPFLRDIKARRGIYDFLVVADESINTPERIDRNELWVNIFIKPTRTAEFIVLNFIATKTGVNFSELQGNV